MQSKLPPLPSLQAFEAAARHENFAAAAKELNLSQSAVSHRVRTLERHLGYPLFERLPRGLRLTEPAKAYLPSLRRAFEEILSATSGIFGHGGRSVLNVRAPISYTVLWLAPLVDRFNAEFPQIEIHLSSSIWTEKIATGETDVEFRIGRGSWPGVEAGLLFRDPLIPVCSPEFAARRNAIDDPAALAEPDPDALPEPDALAEPDTDALAEPDDALPAGASPPVTSAAEANTTSPVRACV